MPLEKQRGQAAVMTPGKGMKKPRSGYRPAKETRTAVYAAIDLGSSNCRMLMATPADGGFRALGSFSRIVRLADGLSYHGHLDAAAMRRTIDALKICAAMIDQCQASRISAVATEACRRAANGSQFTAQVKEETGIAINVISAREESHLTLAGCAPLLDEDFPFALISDIGGGSTELMWVETLKGQPPRMLDMLSIPVGVVDLAERFGGGAVSAKDYAAMMNLADDALLAFDARNSISAEIAKGKVCMLGSSGTVTMLGGLYLKLPCYNRSKVDGLDMNVDAILEIAANLAAMTGHERASIACIGRQRAALAVGGCAFMEAILRRWPVKKLRAADRGVREGLLLGMMTRDGALSPSESGEGALLHGE